VEWTLTPPTEVGWYWMDAPYYGRSIEYVLVRPAHEYLCIIDPDDCAHTKRNFIPVSRMKARWSGPIPEPTAPELIPTNKN